MSLQFENPVCGHMETDDAPCNCYVRRHGIPLPAEHPCTITVSNTPPQWIDMDTTRQGGHVSDIPDVVEHPEHYTKGPIETIEIIEALDLPYHLSAVVKYLARYRYKGKPIEDLKKAEWYLHRFIERLESQPKVDK